MINLYLHECMTLFSVMLIAAAGINPMYNKHEILLDFITLRTLNVKIIRCIFIISELFISIQMGWYVVSLPHLLFSYHNFFLSHVTCALFRDVQLMCSSLFMCLLLPSIYLHSLTQTFLALSSYLSQANCNFPRNISQID